jgi:hypothetical protein
MAAPKTTDFIKNDRVPYFSASCEPVTDASHDCRQHGRPFRFIVAALFGASHVLSDPRFKDAGRHFHFQKITVLDFLWEQHKASVHEIESESSGGFPSTLPSINNVRANLCPDLNIGRRRFSDICQIKPHADLYSVFFDNEITNDFRLDRYPSSIGRDKRLLSHFRGSISRLRGIGSGLDGIPHVARLFDSRANSEPKLLFTCGVEQDRGSSQTNGGEGQNAGETPSTRACRKQSLRRRLFLGLGCFIGGLLFMVGSHAASHHVASV